ncbi:MAG: TPR-like protein [Piptocephalis tieghemiana]|nr:MAG: TPR-like protein [Piptocephalis tieghemiana]
MLGHLPLPSIPGQPTPWNLVADPLGLPPIGLADVDAASAALWRDQILAYAHKLYSTNPTDATLPGILQSLHSRDPDHIPTLLLLGCVYHAQAAPALALQCNREILLRDPQYVEAMSNIGTTLRNMGRSSEAETWWYKAIRLRPHYWDAVENLLGLLCGARERAPMWEGDRDYPATPSASSSSSSIPSPTSPGHSSSSTSSLPLSNSSLFPAHYRFGVATHVSRWLGVANVAGSLRTQLGDVAGARREYERALRVAFGGTLRVQDTCGPFLTARLITLARFPQEEAKGMRLLTQPLLIAPEVTSFLPTILFPETGGILPGLAASGEGPGDGAHSGLGLNGEPDSDLDPSSSSSTAIPGPTNSSSASANATKSAAVISAQRSGTQLVAGMLLALAKCYQEAGDGSEDPEAQEAARNLHPDLDAGRRKGSVLTCACPAGILSLHYLSLALMPTAATCNNLGILLAETPVAVFLGRIRIAKAEGLPSNLAASYYIHGLGLDDRHAHLYTNLGSLMKDAGRLDEAIRLYGKAVECAPGFDVALANLANALKDAGRVEEAVGWYRRAVTANPGFGEAVCGLVSALGAVCDWRGRGGVSVGWSPNPGWLERMVSVVERQLREGRSWGKGCVLLGAGGYDQLGTGEEEAVREAKAFLEACIRALKEGGNTLAEGSWALRLLDKCIRRAQWHWYQERKNHPSIGSHFPSSGEGDQPYQQRPVLPSRLLGMAPPVPTVLPFHTFMYPLSARHIRLISHRNALRISYSTLAGGWLPPHIYPPPSPPAPLIRVGYVSSDLCNHPLAHLMQSVFGMHVRGGRVDIRCYSLTGDDGSPYRAKIAQELGQDRFIDVSSLSTPAIIDRIRQDNIHILVNLNGYTKGARNDIFAARPAPILASYMGFAGTLAAGWCDYFISDPLVCPPEVVGPERVSRMGKEGIGKGPGDLGDDLDPEELVNFSEDADMGGGGDEEVDWVYTEKMVYMPDSYFCCDHKQGFRDMASLHPSLLMDGSSGPVVSPGDERLKEGSWDWWEEEERPFWREQVFPGLANDVVILANFNQLYKVDPCIFQVWLRILARVPKAILWLLRFPAAGEANLLREATQLAGPSVASRIVFTDVAAKSVHIQRGCVADLFLDTPECNGHTTAVDILWSGTPVLTWPRHAHKMCSRVAWSVLGAAFPHPDMCHPLVVRSGEEYEERAVSLAGSVRQWVWRATAGHELPELRHALWRARESSRLFDTARWVRSLERGYQAMWDRWETGKEFQPGIGSIWLEKEGEEGEISGGQGHHSGFSKA